MIIINVVMIYLGYEILAGVQSIKQHLVKNYNEEGFPYMPPTLFFAKDREKYLEWVERKEKAFEDVEEGLQKSDSPITNMIKYK